MDRLKKWPALDIVKFISVLVMIFIHTHFVLITDAYKIIDTSGFFYKISEKMMFLGLFVVILPMIAGATFRAQEDISLKKTLKFSLFIAILGFLMNGLVWGGDYLFSWNVLQFLGLSFLAISFLMRFFSIREIFILSFLVLFSAGWMRNYLSGFDDSYLISIFVGADNQFIFWPFFPWFSIVGFGFIFTDMHQRYSGFKNFNIATFLFGTFLILISFFRGEISPALDPGYIWGPSLFQPSTGFVLGAIGLFLFLITSADFLFRDIEIRRYGIINSYSKGILWIYLFQMFFGAVISLVVKEYFPMNDPTPAYFIPSVLMIFLSWYVGAMSIKILQDKRMNIALRKIK